MKIKKAIDLAIVTSDEPWCEIWHTQLHYAYQLSKRVFVIYLGPPEPWKISHLWKLHQQKRIINDRLLVVTYLNVVPATFGKFSLWVNDHINSWLLKSGILKSFSASKGIIWHFDPHRSYYLFQNSSNFQHIFHVVDPIAGVNLDIPLAELADLVVITSPKFIDHYRKHNKNVIQIAQGIDLAFYKDSVPVENNLANDSILLLGTISNHIHFKLLKSIAHKFPGKLVIIGPDKTSDAVYRNLFYEVVSIPGVRWLGAMEPLYFLDHLKACKVGIIAYDNSRNNRNNLRSPLKVISYLASGKSVVSNIDCEINSLVDKAIYIANDDTQFMLLLEQAYNGNLLFNSTEVDNYLQLINYDTLLETIFNKLNEPLPDLK